jgi:hypothetical protein
LQRIHERIFGIIPGNPAYIDIARPVEAGG